MHTTLARVLASIDGCRRGCVHSQIHSHVVHVSMPRKTTVHGTYIHTICRSTAGITFIVKLTINVHAQRLTRLSVHITHTHAMAIHNSRPSMIALRSLFITVWLALLTHGYFLRRAPHVPIVPAHRRSLCYLLCPGACS